MEILKIKLRKIGNSKGIVIPKRFLEIIKDDLDEITVEVNKDNILLKRSVDVPRKGWAKACKKMALNKDDDLLIPDVFPDENLEEWS